ncbi:hypothetical protein ACFYNO_33210 [Kitasatospora sp. NPDC006697]|uniref:hypothetical protein n=1 Tax=Kitasatospora sp. NPDC006697 TaxID=3364020 RepID=UPI0036C850E0
MSITPPTPFSAPRHLHPVPGDGVEAPAALLSGPGRSRDAAPRWRWVRLRLDGGWRDGRVERWSLAPGQEQWTVLVRWGPDKFDWGWYLYSPDTIRQAPAPPDGAGPAAW